MGPADVNGTSTMSKIHYAPFLYTTRLILRLYDEAKDLAFTASMFGPSFTLDDMRRLDRGTRLHMSLLHGQKAPGTSCYIIHLGSAEGPKIGVISLCQRKEGVAPDIGWSVVPESRNRGVATEAAAECLRYWHEDFGLKEICAFIDAENIASQKVAEHIGLVRKGFVDFTLPSGSVAEFLPAWGLSSMTDFRGNSLNFWGEPEEKEANRDLQGSRLSIELQYQP